MKIKSNLFNPDGHLSEEGIAWWVDALAESSTNKLPAAVSDHVDSCLACKATIIEISHLVRELNRNELDFNDAKVERKGIIRRLYSKIPMLVRFAAVALILIAVGASLGLYFFNQQHNTDRLFAQNFAPYPDLITEKGSSWDEDTTRQLLYTGLGFYRKEQYDSAVFVFHHLYQKDPTSDTIAFFLANSVLATDKTPAEAIAIFTKLINKETFTDQSRWYLALALLKSKDPEGAKKQLTMLVNSPGAYKEKAEAILLDLK